MATVAETELEQKTAEYINFVKEYFVATGIEFYGSPAMRVGVDGEFIILEYWGK